MATTNQVFAYITGGAGTESTILENREAFELIMVLSGRLRVEELDESVLRECPEIYE